MKAIIPIILLFSVFCSHESFGQKTRWITRFESGEVGLLGTSCSKAGNIYVIADFKYSVRLGNDTLVALTGITEHSNFLACLSPDSGKVLWSKQINAKMLNRGSFDINVVVDDSGNCFLYGNVDFGSLSFGNDTILNDVTLTDWGIFVKHDPKGKLLWAKKYRGKGLVNPIQNTKGGLFVLVNQSTYFQMDGKGINDPSGAENLYLLNISSQGALVWCRAIASNCYVSNNRVYKVFIDKNDFLYIMGSFRNDMKFGDIDISGTNFGDFFIGKTDSLGNRVWVKDIAEGGESYSLLYSMDRIDRISVAGNYLDNIRLDNYQFTTKTFTVKDDLSGQFVSLVDSMGHYVWAKDISVPLLNYTVVDMKTDRKGFTYLWENLNTTTSQYPTFLDIYDKDGKENMNTVVPIQQTFLGLDSGDNVIISGQGVGNSTLFGTPNNVSVADAFVASIDFGLVYKPDTIPKDTIKKDTLIKSSTLQLYPNPVAAYGTMFLKDDAGFGSGTSGNIYDVFGRRLTSFAIPVNTTEYKIQVSDWAPAMYFLDINTGTQRLVFKFIVQ